MAEIYKHPRVRIVSNGRNHLQIFDTHTGNEILKGCVRRLTWKIEPPDFLPRAHIELISAAIEGDAELPELIVPQSAVMSEGV